jgi:hypothetical protein
MVRLGFRSTFAAPHKRPLPAVARGKHHSTRAPARVVLSAVRVGNLKAIRAMEVYHG